MRAQAFVTALVGLDPLVREGLIRILRPAGFRIAASVARIDESAFVALPQDRPLLLILDAGHNPRAAIGQIQRARKDCSTGRLAVLAPYYRHADVVSAFRAGASCYLVRTMAGEALIKSLELVMLGQTILPPTFLSHMAHENDSHGIEPAEIGGEVEPAPLLAADDAPRLSVREERILRCLVQGDSNKAIARKISISEATVKVHVKAILRKIRVHNRTQAAIWAIHKGLLAAAGREVQSPPLSNAAPTAPELLAVERLSEIALQIRTGSPLEFPGVNGVTHRERS